MRNAIPRYKYFSVLNVRGTMGDTWGTSNFRRRRSARRVAYESDGARVNLIIVRSRNNGGEVEGGILGRSNFVSSEDRFRADSHGDVS